MFNWISTSLILMFAVNCYAVTPWYTIYDDPKRLNDSQIWQEHIEELMKQYQSNIGDRSYQSEAHSIARGLEAIENPEVVELLWKYYTSGGPYKNVAQISCFDVALKNSLMQNHLIAEFLNSRELEFRFSYALRMLWWEQVPEIAMTFLFDSLDQLSAGDRLKALSTLMHLMVHRKQPIQHFRLIEARTLARLEVTRPPEEVKELSQILAQLERWTGNSYSQLVSLSAQGRIPIENLAPLVKALSYAVNGIIGATFDELKPASVDAFFKVLTEAKNNSAPEVRAAAVEASLWQLSKPQFPQELKDWIAESKSDPVVNRSIISFYSNMGRSSQTYLSKAFPGVFPKPRNGVISLLTQRCADALSIARDWLPF